MSIAKPTQTFCKKINKIPTNRNNDKNYKKNPDIPGCIKDVFISCNKIILPTRHIQHIKIEMSKRLRYAKKLSAKG